MSDEKKYPYVEITRGDFTMFHYRYMLRLRMGPGKVGYSCQFADTLGGARRKAKKMLDRYCRGLEDGNFKEEVRL